MKYKFEGTKEDSIALIKRKLDDNKPSKMVLNSILTSVGFNCSNNKALFHHILLFFFDKASKIKSNSKTSNDELDETKLLPIYEHMREYMTYSEYSSDETLKKYYEYAKLLIEMSRPNKPDNIYFPFDEE